MRNHIRDRVARFWHGGDVIFAKKGRQCGGNLALSDSVDSSAFAESACIRTEEGYPNIFRVRNFLAVVFPFVRGLSASVVGQENEGGVARYSGSDCGRSQRAFT